MITRNCDVCQTEYQAETRYLNRGQGRTCSRACGAVLSASVKNRAHDPNTECGQCHTPLYRKPSQLKKTSVSFCNTRCQNLGYAAGVVKPGRKSSGRKIYSPKPSIYEQNVQMWLSGNNDATLNRSRSTGLPTDTKHFVKRYLIETRGDKCEDCGFSGVNRKTGNSIIQMDHINGNCFDNAPENLKLLCPNCHAMTETYGALNKGSGRAHRRKSDTV